LEDEMLADEAIYRRDEWNGISQIDEMSFA